MDLPVFAVKVREAARTLIGFCSYGDPTEEEVIRATEGSGLCIFKNSESYVGDPVRLAVFVEAYRPRINRNMTMDQVIENAWKWHEKLGVETSA